MDLTKVNWKTTSFGIGYAVCKTVGYFVEAVEPLCTIIEPMIVTGGFISATDTSRVRNIVRAVDLLLAKSNIDPETLAPIRPITASTPSELLAALTAALANVNQKPAGT